MIYRWFEVGTRVELPHVGVRGDSARGTIVVATSEQIDGPPSPSYLVHFDDLLDPVEEPPDPRSEARCHQWWGEEDLRVVSLLDLLAEAAS